MTPDTMLRTSAPIAYPAPVHVPMALPAAFAMPMQAPSPPPLGLPAMGQVMAPRSARRLGITRPRWRGEILVAIVCLWGLIVSSQMAYVNGIFETKSVAGIPHHMLMTAATMALAVICDGGYLIGLLLRPKVLFYLLCLGLMAAIGVARGGGMLIGLFSDIYVVRWFFVGFMLMRAAIVSGTLKSFLTVAALVVLATTLRIDFRNSLGGQLNSAEVRVTSIDFWPVLNLGTIMFGLLLTVTWPQGLGRVIFGVSMFAMLILLGGVRSSTRSLFLFQSLCFVLSLFALSRDPRMWGRGRAVRQILVVAMLFLAAFMAYKIVRGQMLENMTQLGTRFSEENFGSRSTSTYRLREAEAFLQALEPDAWLIGLGFGIRYWNPMGKGSWADLPHIAVLGWLMKGGIVVFCMVLWTLYISPAIAFFRATVVARQERALPPPILVVGPPLLAWASLTFISGGIDIGSFLALGGLCALWAQLADDERRFVWSRGAGRRNAARVIVAGTP